MTGRSNTATRRLWKDATNTPGLSFNTGLVLHYDDMPTLKTRVTLDDDGTFTLGSIGTAESDNDNSGDSRSVL